MMGVKLLEKMKNRSQIKVLKKLILKNKNLTLIITIKIENKNNLVKVEV